MAIYTRTGDGGTCGFGNGKRLSKADARVVLLGEIDELNSHLGLLIAMMREKSGLAQFPAGDLEMLGRVQWDLISISGNFAMGRALDSPLDDGEAICGRVAQIERRIDALRHNAGCVKISPPGGSLMAGEAHVTRSVCRRAERGAVALMEGGVAEGDISPMLLYLNRLSDYLYCIAAAMQ